MNDDEELGGADDDEQCQQVKLKGDEFGGLIGNIASSFMKEGGGGGGGGGGSGGNDFGGLLGGLAGNLLGGGGGSGGEKLQHVYCYYIHVSAYRFVRTVFCLACLTNALKKQFLLN